MILLHTSMALMDSDVSSTCFNCLETSTTSAMVRLLPSTARVALVGNEGSRHCERTKPVNEGIEGAMLIQNKAGSQKSKGKEGTMKVPLFYILFHLKMAIYNSYQKLQLLRSVTASTMSNCHIRAGFPLLCITSFMKESMGERVCQPLGAGRRVGLDSCMRYPRLDPWA